MSSKATAVHLVVQRYRSCRLLLNEVEWVRQGGGGSATEESFSDDRQQQQQQQPKNNTNHHVHRHRHQHCGLLLYVSFAADADRAAAAAAAETCLNLPVLTAGLWGDGVSDQFSVRQLLRRRQQNNGQPIVNATSVTIVPQANLISKVKSQGTSLQYHGQIEKAQGGKLYEFFVDCIFAAVFEEQCRSRDEPVPEWFVARKLNNERLEISSSDAAVVTTTPQQLLDPSIPPTQVFRLDPSCCDHYGSFDDETGLPVMDAQGQMLTKSATKKLRKLQEAHAKRHEKWKEKQTDNTGTAVGTHGTTAIAAATAVAQYRTAVTKTYNNVQSKGDPPIAAAAIAVDWKAVLDPSFCSVVAGTFGKRQGLEFQSDMGPFCHVLQI